MLKSSNQSVYVGEFGVKLPDRRDSHSRFYNYTRDMIQMVREENLLATYWVWEFPDQNSTWSIYPGKDDETIDVLLR